jgi:hypothetical protein
MRIKEGFGKYWLAGLIFSIIFGAITTVLNFFSTNLAAYVTNLLPGIIGGLLLLVMGVLIFIFVPWMVGRLVGWVYLEFIDKKS